MGSSHLNKTHWGKQRQKLTDYAISKGYNVILGVDKDKASWIQTNPPKTVFVHTSSILEYQVYDFIHELGHMAQQDLEHRYEHRYSYVLNNFSVDSLTHRIKILEEEIDAWNLGYTLSKELGVQVIERRFEMRKAARINAYVKWITKQSNKENK